MKNINKILFPTDFSPTAQNAFRYALQFADKYKAAIELVHVVYPEYEAVDVPVMSASMTQSRMEASQEAFQAFISLGLTQVGNNLEHIPITSTQVEIGGPTVMINKVAENSEADLIIMGTKETHNFFEETFGSVTTDIARKAPCHILVIPEGAEFKEMETVMYATDFSEAEAFHIWNVMQMLYVFKPAYHITHVNTGSRTTLSMDDITDFFAKNAPEVDITFHDSTSKSVTDSLEQFLNTHDVDVMAMHSPNRGLVERAFHKSVTKHMILHTKTPLFIYKEEGI